MDPEAVADALTVWFPQYFYRLVDGKYQDLGNLYEEDSMLTFEGNRFQGKESILSKLHSLPQCQHRIKTADGQPSGPAHGVLVLVKGVLNFIGQDGKLDAVNFTETFQLMPNQQGGFYILNDLFRVGQGAL